MTKADLTAFKDFVLSNNKYFDTGFEYAFKDEETRKLFAQQGNEWVCVMPRDEVGNYFYLRVDSGLSFAQDLQGRATDCGAGRMGFNDLMIMQWVAVVKDADEFKLLNNMRNTAMSYTGLNIIPTGAQIVRELVMTSELAGLEDLNIALKNLKNETIVRVTLNVNKKYVANTCIVDICKDC